MGTLRPKYLLYGYMEPLGNTEFPTCLRPQPLHLTHREEQLLNLKFVQVHGRCCNNSSSSCSYLPNANSDCEFIGQ